MWLLHHAAACHYHSDVRRNPRFALKSTSIVALVLFLTSTIPGQQNGQNTAAFNPAVYRVGERLTYNINFAHFVSAAHVELLVAARGNFFNRDAIELRAHVETSGVVNVALYALNNDYTTYVDSQTGLPFRVQHVVREPGQKSEQAVDYNETSGVYDLLSALYHVRGMALTDGASYTLTVRNESDEYAAEVRVAGRQAIKTSVGSFNAIVTRVALKSGHDYNLRAYFSDDDRHVPVLITAKVASGEVRAELAGSEFVLPTKSSTAKTVATPGPLMQDARPVPTPSVGSVTEDPKSSATTPTTLAGLDLPFKVGEQLNYRVYLGETNQPVGLMTFTVRARGRYFNRDGLLLTATAQTIGLSGSIFVNDQINSYVDPQTLLPFRTELRLAEGRWRATKGYTLDQDRGSVVTDNRNRILIPVGTHDLLSALYAIRTFDLSRLKQNAISLLATDKPRTLLVNSQRRETVELNGQKISAIMLTLTTDDPADKMQLRMWVGDDSRRLPLRIAAVTPLGIAHADLVIVPTTTSQ